MTVRICGMKTNIVKLVREGKGACFLGGGFENLGD